MKKHLKGLMTITLIFVFAIALTGCGNEETLNNGGGTTGGSDKRQEQGNNIQEIDLSQFTAVELPASELLEDWMKPSFGVVTIAGEEMMGYYYSFTISGVTQANVDSYKSLIESKGWTLSYSLYKKDDKKLALGTSAVGKTKDSIMTVTITKD